ncbi:hypothetical protein NliqN6_5390 [Naganishia liquefaciens]|uniref:Uncharacterized protein n=1 Tax=Naganishia liquefaciens TaxID=104408 RepID=A0A8H3YH51_9TREE|nr:hypothetical protein NliqN6_5390 [Naganishia liquefaciens]
MWPPSPLWAEISRRMLARDAAQAREDAFSRTSRSSLPSNPSEAEQSLASGLGYDDTAWTTPSSANHRKDSEWDEISDLIDKIRLEVNSYPGTLNDERSKASATLSC